MNKRTFTFSVQTDYPACIRLCNIPSHISTRAYEYCIGTNGNTATSFRRIGQFNYEVSTPNIVDANVEKYFWFSYTKDGVFQLGEGSAESPTEGRIIINNTDTDPLIINSIKFTTRGGLGKWRIINATDDEGK